MRKKILIPAKELCYVDESITVIAPLEANVYAILRLQQYIWGIKSCFFNILCRYR